jgi:uncharacterized protein YbcI
MADIESMDGGGLRGSISSSLASVWKNYSGERPTDVDTVISGTRVACVLKGAVRGFDEGMAASADDEDAETRRLTTSTFRNDAINAVTRATRRKVMAFVSDHNSKTDVATEVFILDLPPRA